MKILFLLAIISIGSMGVATPPTLAETETAESGNVRAEFSYQNQEWCLENPQLQISRDGQIVFNQSLSEGVGICPFTDLQVRNLDVTPEPEVILDVYTGDEHCCWVSLIYHYDAAQNTYLATEQFWGNAGYQFKDLNQDNIPEFLSRDDSFAYAFTAYAGSSFPLQIWQYRNSKMVDVTRSYPQLIYNDAYQLWQRYTETDYPGVAKGALAAYLADKYMLGQSEDGWQRVRQAYQGDDRESFFNELRQFLQQTGYIRNPGETAYYRLAELEQTGLYNQCPQGSRLMTAGETDNYRFAICAGDLSRYYIGQSKRTGDSITVKHKEGDSENDFRHGDTVYRLRMDETDSANLYLEVYQNNRQLLMEMAQTVYNFCPHRC